VQIASQQRFSMLTLEAADFLRLSPDALMRHAIAGKTFGQPIDDK
jgi:hypothetical protein